jgi:hypothetical protein
VLPPVAVSLSFDGYNRLKRGETLDILGFRLGIVLRPGGFFRPFASGPDGIVVDCPRPAANRGAVRGLEMAVFPRFRREIGNPFGNRDRLAGGMGSSIGS